MRTESRKAAVPRPEITTWSFPSSLLGFVGKDGKRPPSSAVVAYMAFFSLVGEVDRTFDLSMGEVMALTGFSEQASRRAVERLILVGLVTRFDQAGDRWIMCCNDPSVARRARLGDRSSPQMELPAMAPQASAFTPDTISQPAPVAIVETQPAPVAEVAPLRLRLKTSPSAKPKASPAQGHKSKSALALFSSLSQGSAGCDIATGVHAVRDAPSTPSVRVGEPVAIGSILGQLNAPQESAAQREERVLRLAQAIHDDVGDPELQLSPCRRAAQAVVDGRLKRRELDRLLAYVRKQKRLGTKLGVWNVFVGTLKRRFREDGIPWEATKPK